jgi:hypothetical protein
MNARERVKIMVRTDRGNMTVWGQTEVRDALDAFAAEARAEALNEAAAHLLGSLVRSPEGEVEEHLNHVLTDLAEQIKRMGAAS